MGRKKAGPKLSAGAALVKLRWDKATEADRRAQGLRLTKARAKLTPEERKEIARKAGIASAAARWGFKEEERKSAGEKAEPEMDPELGKARRREIASAAAKARWAKAGSGKQDDGKAARTKTRNRRKKGGPGIP